MQEKADDGGPVNNAPGMEVDNDTRMANEMITTMDNCEVQGCPYGGGGGSSKFGDAFVVILEM